MRQVSGKAVHMIDEHSIASSPAGKPGPHTIDVVIIFVLGILLRLPFLPTTGDDAYITFRYARNLISGLGYVFNPGEHVLGTTTPLYTLYLALAGRLGLDFILVGKLTNIVADTAAVVILFLVVSRYEPDRGLGAGHFAFILTL